MDKGYTVFYSPHFVGEFRKLSDEHKKLVMNKISLLENDPFYKSLRTKKIKGNYESSVNMDIRIIWRFEGLQIFLINIGHHDVIRKYNKKRK
jgi:mRNA-degrading endonuclease RelE of RelBE toxin-antitoxin system